jgi:hypothetical protein
MGGSIACSRLDRQEAKNAGTGRPSRGTHNYFEQQQPLGRACTVRWSVPSVVVWPRVDRVLNCGLKPAAGQSICAVKTYEGGWIWS